jgi:hypothetical protein
LLGLAVDQDVNYVRESEYPQFAIGEWMPRVAGPLV